MGDFLAVLWLGLGAFLAVAQVQSQVRELRSSKLYCAAKNKNKNKTKNSRHKHGCFYLTGLIVHSSHT